MISETMPLNEWPVEKLYSLQFAVEEAKEIRALSGKDADELIAIIKSAIKDAEQELSQLPFS